MDSLTNDDSLWSYDDHQIEGADWSLTTLRKYGFAYIAWQERVRKTGAAILTAENSSAKTTLIVTKKKAIAGWNKHLANLPTTKKYVVINYESIHKVVGTFDLIILDEAHHAISSVGRPSETWKKVYKHTKGKAILYLSATPYAEHLGLIYHQLKLSDWSPFKAHRNFYEWFKVYGISNMTRTPFGLVEQYNKYKDEEILTLLKPCFYFKTRKEAGIEHEPTVNVIKVPMDSYTKELIAELLKESVLDIGDQQVICDSPMKLRTVHYQLEGSTIKTDGLPIILPTREKVQYIRNNYDITQIAVMAHFIAERELLERELPDARILSSDGDAEGVDLSDVDKLIVYSMSEKTSKFTQRLARQANHDREDEIVVDVLVADKPGIGYGIYDSVAVKKENFNKNSYDRFTKGM